MDLQPTPLHFISQRGELPNKTTEKTAQMCVKLYHYIRECLDTPRRIVLLGDFLKDYHFDSAQCNTPNEFDDLLFEIAGNWSRDPHKVYTVRLIPPFDFVFPLFEGLQSKISLIYFMPDTDSVMKANFVGKQSVIFPPILRQNLG